MICNNHIQNECIRDGRNDTVHNDDDDDDDDVDAMPRDITFRYQFWLCFLEHNAII